MANPQPDKYLRISTELAEIFCRSELGSQEWRIMWVIIRKTWGYNKTKDIIPLGQFEILTGMDRRNINRTIKLLIIKNVIFCESNPTGNIYGIQKDYERWKLVVSPKTLLSSVSRDTSKASVSQDTPPSVMPLCDDQCHAPVWIPVSSKTPSKYNRQKTGEVLFTLEDEVRTFRMMGWSPEKIKNHFKKTRNRDDFEIDQVISKEFEISIFPPNVESKTTNQPHKEEENAGHIHVSGDSGSEQCSDATWDDSGSTEDGISTG